MPARFSERFVNLMPGMPPLNRAAFQRLAQAFYAAFPDLRHSVEDQVLEGNTVVNRLLVRGTHHGEYQGILPTGRPVEFAGITIQRFENGELVEQHLILDTLGLRQQLGTAPSPG